MIEHYSITATPEKIRERFAVDVPEFFKPRYNACPTQLLPVITNSAPEGVSTFYWGTSPEWSKNKSLSEKIINTQVEFIHDKPAIKKILMKSRCIVPADGFYAWKRAGKKTRIPYRCICTDQELFSFAGLWEEYEDTEGNEFHTFTIITTPATPLVASIQERMPVILSPKQESIWLAKDSTETDLMEILKAYSADRMSHYPVSPRISDVMVDVPSLIRPAPASDQFGNLTLFD
ncbi:SOS response-associated peptidase [Ohtaekwangia sp.]|uniref:SOS response-associated peptidase n=1 Tax=Ohtaekwangia sp. TaxID=2066019 RepID=UPI002F9403A9